MQYALMCNVRRRNRSDALGNVTARRYDARVNRRDVFIIE